MSADENEMTDDLEPDAQTQARIIMERLRSDPTTQPADNVTVDDLADAVDPDVPIPVNMKRLADSFAV